MSEQKINDGGSAYPQHGWTKDPDILNRMGDKQGMTLRQWYAGQALAGIVSCHKYRYKDGDYDYSRPDYGGTETEPTDLAATAFDYADAMIAHEQKEQGNE